MVGVSFVKGVSGYLLQPWKKICKQWVLCIVKLPIVDCDISTATSCIAKFFKQGGHTLSHLGYLLDCPVDIHKMLQNSDLSFKSALLIPSILMNALHSTSLFLCYSHYHVPTNTISSISWYLSTNHTQHTFPFFPLIKGLTLKLSA